MAAMKLSLKQRYQVMMLNRQWETADDAGRLAIEKQIKQIKHQAISEARAEEVKAKEAKPDGTASTDNETENTFSFDKYPYAPYCEYTDIMSMVKVNKAWMTYRTFCCRYPDKTIFDCDPDDVTVMYINHEAYQRLLETKDLLELDHQTVMSNCARQLPESAAATEVAILNHLLWLEAQHDDRIANLGCYDLTSVESSEKSKLFGDFYDRVIFNSILCEMTIEEARTFAETGEVPETPQSEETAGQNQTAETKQPEQNTQNAQNAVKKPGQGQPPKKQSNQGTGGQQKGGQTKGSGQKTGQTGQKQSGQPNQGNNGQQKGAGKPAQQGKPLYGYHQRKPQPKPVQPNQPPFKQNYAAALRTL